MKEQETAKGKVITSKLSGTGKTTAKKPAKAKVPAKRQNQNHATEISKIYKKLKAVCIRLYKADKENQKLICMILLGEPGRGMRGK